MKEGPMLAEAISEMMLGQAETEGGFELVVSLADLPTDEPFSVFVGESTERHLPPVSSDCVHLDERKPGSASGMRPSGGSVPSVPGPAKRRSLTDAEVERLRHGSAKVRGLLSI
jgi:hypothetical protein